MRRIMISFALLAAAVVSLTALSSERAAGSPQQSKSKNSKTSMAMNYGNSDAITQDELKVYDYFLASDQLEGRYFPSRGYDTAALYVASHMAEWGLKPLGSTSGTNGPLQPYLMPIEMVSRQIVSEESKASVTAPAPAGRGGRGGGGGGGGGARGGAPAQAQLRTTDFEYGKEWTYGGGGGGGRGGGGTPAATLDVAGNLVFVGNGYVVNKTNTNPYEGLNVSGKVVVVAGIPPDLAAFQAAQLAAGRGGRGGGTPPENPLGKEPCKDYLTPEQAAAKNGAIAVITIATYQQLTGMANANAAGAGRGAAVNGLPFQVAKFQPAPACAVVPNVAAGMTLTNAIFQGEKMAAADVFYKGGSNSKMDSFELTAEKKVSFHVAVHSEGGHGENVVAMLEGSDPVLKNEYVIMSAHLDHIGLTATPLPDGHNVNNGADDDGSGSTGLLGIAHAYATGAAKGMRPKRSIIFLWNGGEERGLWGSQYFNMFPPIDLTKVVADLNMDMIGRTKNPASLDPDPSHFLVNPGEMLIVGPNISSDDLEKTIETVNNSYEKLKINHFYDVTAPDATHDNLGPGAQGQRIFYRSDHYNFARNGIPIAFFTIGLHVDYHRPTDTPEKIDYEELQKISKTVAGVCWVLANQAGRPALNAKLPDQLITDMKAAQAQGWGKITPVLSPLPGMPY
ncbi:MAG: M28 family peptidase [Candidatus Acidiferrales bacterium]